MSACVAMITNRLLGVDVRVRCGITDEAKPMTFRGTDWCCDNHRKLVDVQASVQAAADQTRLPQASRPSPLVTNINAGA